MPLEVRREKGVIAITPASLPVKLERKGCLRVAVPTNETPSFTRNNVDRLAESYAKERV